LHVLLSSARSKLLVTWLAALLLSGGLAWAGHHWPEPLAIDLGWVLGLVLVPPALMGLWLLLGSAGWRRGHPANRRRGESLHSGQEQQG
jgi:hypothetical protein